MLPELCTAPWSSSSPSLSAAALAPAAHADPTATPVAGIAEAGDSIARGPGGSIWVAHPKAPGRITRIDADGTHTDFTGGTTANLPSNRKPSGIVALEDGNVWFLMNGGGEELGRITPAGTVIRYVLRRGTPTSLAAGPDGALWMTANGGGTDEDDGDRTVNYRDAIVRYEAGEDVDRPLRRGPHGQHEPLRPGHRDRRRAVVRRVRRPGPRRADNNFRHRTVAGTTPPARAR